MALFKGRDRFLGIDISASAVKLVELSRNGQRLQVEAVAMEPLPEGTVEDRNPTDPEEVGAAIKRALKTSGTHLKHAAVAVPTSSVITRTLPMPAEYGDDDIEASIQIEAAQYIPFPLEEIYIDFQVQAGSKALAETQEVMLVASRKEYVDLRADALSEAGLKPSIVDVEAYALENAYPILEEGASASDVDGKRGATRVGDVRVALVDMGATITTLYVFQESKVIFAREQAFGGDQLTASIADTYGLEKGKAELAKRSGELSEDYPATILAPFKQSAAEQIGNALQFFFSSSHYNSVDKIILVGGGALVPGLAAEVARRLKIPTIIGSCFEQMGNATRVNRRGLLRDAPLYTVACGLAMRSFDA